MEASPRPTDDEAALLEVAYNEASRALVEQLSLIDGIRNRAGWLLSAAAITTSVLGSQALDHSPIGLAVWVALGAFFAVALLTMAILWPKPRELAADVAQVIDSCAAGNGPQSVAQLRYFLTLRMRKTCVDNWSDLSQLAALFEISCCLMALEIAAWIATVYATA